MNLIRQIFDRAFINTHVRIPMTNEPEQAVDTPPPVQVATMVPTPALGDLTAQYEAAVRAQMTAILQAPEPTPDTWHWAGGRFVPEVRQLRPADPQPAPQEVPVIQDFRWAQGIRGVDVARPAPHMIGLFQISHSHVNFQTDRGMISIDLKTGAVTSPDGMGPLDAAQSFWDAVEATLRPMPEQLRCDLVPCTEATDPWNTDGGPGMGPE